MHESGNTGRNSYKEIERLCLAGSPLIETESVWATLVCAEGVKQSKETASMPGDAERDFVGVEVVKATSI